MKVIVHGKEMQFSDKELTSIVEEHFERRLLQTEFTALVTATPTEGNWFIVRPMMIDQSLFAEQREDKNQETTRQRILKAFEEVEKNPQKYAKPFKTLYPSRPWDRTKGKTPQELENLAKEIGDGEAEETEQALQWAQQIYNGESWESICNLPDSARSYRIVKTKYPGLHNLVGGSTDAEPRTKTSATNVLEEQFTYYENVGCTVPLIVSRKNIPGT